MAVSERHVSEFTYQVLKERKEQKMNDYDIKSCESTGTVCGQDPVKIDTAKAVLETANLNAPSIARTKESMQIVEVLDGILEGLDMNLDSVSSEGGTHEVVIDCVRHDSISYFEENPKAVCVGRARTMSDIASLLLLLSQHGLRVSDVKIEFGKRYHILDLIMREF